LRAYSSIGGGFCNQGYHALEDQIKTALQTAINKFELAE
jgi:hypothetical protein